MNTSFRDRYRQHLYHAQIRKIAFELTFEEWRDIWIESGHWSERGCRRGQYVMARLGDKGAYAVGNVKIITVTENAQEWWTNPENRARNIEASKKANTGNTYSVGRKASEETRAKLRKARKLRPPFLGRHHSAEARAKISSAMQGNTHGLGNKAHLGRRASVATRRKMGLSQKRAWLRRRVSIL